MKNNRIYLKLFLICLFGVLIRLMTIDKSGGLWNDEYVSWYISTKPLFKEFIAAVYKNCHMPFYYLYLKFFTCIFGHNDTMLRITSVIPSVLGAIVMFFNGKMMKDEKCGLLCAAIISFSGFMIYFAQEVRFYSLLFLFSALCIFFTLRLFEKQTVGNYVGLYLSAMTVMLTHTIGFVFVFFNFLFVFSYLKIKKAISIKIILLITFLTAISMLPFAPFLYKTLTASYISQFWSDFSLTKLFFVLADYSSPIQINLINTPLHISTLIFKGGKFNLGYFIFAVIPMIILMIGLLTSLFKKDNKVYILLEIGFLTLLITIIASSMGKIVLITKYTMEIFPIFILLTAFGLYMLRPAFIRQLLLFVFFALTCTYLLISDYAPQKLERPEGHKYVANLINDAHLKNTDKILLLYYDADRFGKYLDTDNYSIEAITKYNFQYRLINNPPLHDKVISDGKYIFYQTFKDGNNDFFNEYLKITFFDKMKPHDKFAIIFINSVTFIDDKLMQDVVNDKSLYKRMPFLFLIFSHMVNNTKATADITLKQIFTEKQGKWEIIVWEKE